jgi:hypothetical protein
MISDSSTPTQSQYWPRFSVAPCSHAMYPSASPNFVAASFDNRSRMLMSPHVASAEVEPIPTFVHTHEQAGERFVEGEDVGVKPFADA